MILSEIQKDTIFYRVLILPLILICNFKKYIISLNLIYNIKNLFKNFIKKFLCKQDNRAQTIIRADNAKENSMIIRFVAVSFVILIRYKWQLC